MGLLSKGRTEVTVTPTERTRDDLGAPVRTPGAPVVRRGIVEPVTAAEIAADPGLRADTEYRFIGRGPWPGGPRSKVTWAGRSWEQIGEARVYGTGRRTAHVVVLIKAAGTVAQ